MHDEYVLHYCHCRCYKGLYVKELVSITSEVVLNLYTSLYICNMKHYTDSRCLQLRTYLNIDMSVWCRC